MSFPKTDKHRFFYQYKKKISKFTGEPQISLTFRKGVYVVDNIICDLPITHKSYTRPGKDTVVMHQGMAEGVQITEGTKGRVAIIT